MSPIHLQYALEDEAPLYLEVARYLQHDQLQDPRWDHYHAAVQLQVRCQCRYRVQVTRKPWQLKVASFLGMPTTIHLSRAFPSGSAPFLSTYQPCCYDADSLRTLPGTSSPAQGVEVLAELGSTEYRLADPLPVRAFASASCLTSVLPTYAPSNV